MADGSCLHSHPTHNSHSSSTYPAWDLHNLALFNSDHISLAMESMITTPPYFSTIGCDSYLLSGYLEDVLFDYGNPSKRRRLLYTTDERVLDSTYTWPSLQSRENLNHTNHVTTNNGLSTWGTESRSTTSLEECIILSDIQSSKESSWALQDALDCSSSSVKEIDTMSWPKFGCNEDNKSRHLDMTCQESGNSTGMIIKKKRSTVLKSFVYPFALVKPGWEEGDVTLNDINKRMLMPPTRPIRHPVGDFACHPCVSQPHGPGLSGKAVVALTRIRTLGRGTITIIRTKG